MHTSTHRYASLPTPLGRDGIFLENEIDISACNMEKVHVTMVDVRGDDGSVDRLGMLVLVPTCTHMCTHTCIHMRTHMHTVCIRGHQIHTCTIQCGGGPEPKLYKSPQTSVSIKSDQCWVNVCPVLGPVVLLTCVCIPQAVGHLSQWAQMPKK